ncbi:hypothetical protein [Rufibacter sp. LB8]|nr:hypothetical protein [Rufibacter sp. LB8]
MGALKEDLHKLIESTEDEALLQNIFMLLSNPQQPAGQIWESLSAEQRQQVLDNEAEIDDPKAWLSHEDQVKANAPWLK